LSLRTCASDGVFSERQINDAIFALLVHKVCTRSFQEVESLLQEPWFGVRFPNGIYNQYLQHGWPRAAFKYENTVDLLEVMREQIIAGEARKDFTSAARMASFLFGSKDAPAPVEQTALLILRRINESFHQEAHEAEETFENGSARERELWSRYLLSLYVQLVDLDGIMSTFPNDSASIHNTCPG
jgi:hypothetical protein